MLSKEHFKEQMIRALYVIGDAPIRIAAACGRDLSYVREVLSKEFPIVDRETLAGVNDMSTWNDEVKQRAERLNYHPVIPRNKHQVIRQLFNDACFGYGIYDTACKMGMSIVEVQACDCFDPFSEDIYTSLCCVYEWVSGKSINDIAEELKIYDSDVCDFLSNAGYVTLAGDYTIHDINRYTNEGGIPKYLEGRRVNSSFAGTREHYQVRVYKTMEVDAVEAEQHNEQ